MPSLPSQLVCPTCLGPLEVLGDGTLVCALCGRVGQFNQGVWDFIGTETYAESFGRQWELFHHTQLDSRNGTTISQDQFEKVTGWSKADVDGHRLVDGGCGSGRYAEIALCHGAEVTALDLSVAAYVTRRNFPEDENLTVVRGNLLSPPLKRGSYDKVFSLGVVQSTPDPLHVARQLAALVRPGGELAIWMYDKRWYSPLLPRTIIWPLTRRLSPDDVLRVSRGLVAAFTPVARAAGKLRSANARRLVRGALPIASYWGDLPLSPEQHREWSVLDTHDWLSPVYNLPQTFEVMRDTLVGAGLTDVHRLDAPGLSLVAVRPG